MQKQFLTILILFSLSFANGQVNLDSGLIFYYPFDGNTNDSSSNHIDGTWMTDGTTISNPIYTEDRFGNPNHALFFTDRSFVQVNSSTMLNTLQRPFTFSGWLRIDSLFQTGSLWASIIAKGGFGFGDVQLRVAIDGANNSYWLSPLGCSNLLSSHALTLNQWRYLTIIENVNDIVVYVNGQLDNTYPCSTPLTSNANYHLLIGKDTPGAIEYFKGIMDELRIYNRALNLEEIQVLAVAENNVNKAEAIVYPNPNDGNFNVIFKNTFFENATLTIHNILGERISEVKLVNEVTRLNVDVMSGVYFATVSTEKGNYTQKIIIQR